MKNKLVTLTTLLLLSLVGSSAYAKNICEKRNSDYLVGFFNGVYNSQDDAYDGLRAVQHSLSSRYRGEEVSYELFYNTNEGFFADLQETYAMRDHETEQYWEGFWSRDATNNWDAREKANAFIQAKAKASASAYERLLTNKVTLKDLSEHRILMEKFILTGKKILLVGHSQGNLFENAAYDVGTAFANRLYEGGESSIKAVHIAPASKYLRGDYILADTDIVINGMPGKTVSPNLVIPSAATSWWWWTGCNATDITGHQLVSTYLNSSILHGCYHPGSYDLPYERFRSIAYSALNRLQTPRSSITEGYFDITLSWNGNADLDLEIEEPRKDSVVNYSRKEGSAGRLDHDATSGPGIEHYYAYCDSDNIVGTYKVYVNLYNLFNSRQWFTSRDLPLRARVVITSSDGRFKYTSDYLDIDLERERKKGNKLHLVNLEVSRSWYGYSIRAIPQH